jgi:hypothetical protein
VAAAEVDVELEEVILLEPLAAHELKRAASANGANKERYRSLAGQVIFEVSYAAVSSTIRPLVRDEILP